MSHVYIVPHWFFGFGIGMEVLFAIIAMAVAFYSFKIYNVSAQREVKFLGISFSLISLSYLLWAVLNLFLLSDASNGFRELDVNNFISLSSTFTLFHMILFTLGLITLVYAEFKLKDGRVYYILAGLSLLVVVSSFNTVATFRILSVFMLSFIVYHYLTQCSTYKNKKAIWVSIAFSLLLLSNIGFIFASKFYMTYVIGHILEFFAYALILSSLISSIKK